MMKINVYSEKSGNFGAESKMKPMIIIESRKRPLEPGQKDKNGKPILSLKEKYPGIWQGLKVFEDVDIDTSLFSKPDMKNMKRTTRKYGPMRGHRKGVHGEELLGYLTARKEIYLKCYKWVLENKLQKLVTAIRIISKNKPVVLLDYNTNTDVWNPKSPLSHASLIKAYIEGNYPE